jgi:FHA domain
MAITPGIVPPKRVLKLNPDRLSVPIGRASKSVSKGLLSAEDNAWFDNPVMSRDHAELVFDPDDMVRTIMPLFLLHSLMLSQAILIKDIRSMHGTMLNDQKVPIDTLQQVTTGDVVSFGAEVRRGPDTFPPCCFDIAYEFVPWTSVEIPLVNLQYSADSHTDSRGFQFPDSSDIEDDQDLFEEEDGSQEGDVTPAESPLPKTSTAVDAIDLTKEDSESVDATSQGLAAEEVADPQGIIPFMAQGANNQATGRIENPITLDDVSSDEADEDEIEESEQQDEEESDGESEEDSDKENYEESEEEPEDVVEESIYDSDSSDATPAEDNQDASMVSDPHNEPHQVQTHMFYDNKDIPVSSMRSTVARFPEANMQGDTQDQNIYPRTSGPFSWSKENIDESPEHEPVMPPALPTAALDTSQLLIMGGDDPCVDNGNALQLRSFMSSGPSTGSAPGLDPQTQSIHRQPSPSDAAMAKSFKNGSLAPPSKFSPANQIINPVYINNVVANNWNQAKAQSLGDRTGKHEFFQAREINRARANEEESRHTEHKAISDGIAKAKFNQLGHPYNPRPNAPINGGFSGQLNYNPQQNFFSNDQRPYPPTMHPHQQAAQQQMMLQQRLAQQNIASQHHMQKIAQQQQMAAQHIAQRLAAQQRSLASSNCFGNVALQSTPTSSESQTCPDRPLRPITPEPDMTSAVKFNQSKLLIAAQRASSQPSRSAVRIDDIVEPSVAEPAIKSLKRKASEISEVLEEEVRVWASKDSSIVAEKSDPSPDLPVGTSTQKTQDDSSSNDAVIVAEEAPQQPATKKLKRFAENVAYFALGGIALSAGLFSILVNTAPDFPDA